MAKIKGIELSEVDRAALEEAHRHGPSHAFRQRYQMVLLKNQGSPSREVVEKMGGCELVNRWLERYRSEGLDGRQTRSDRSRKVILGQDNLSCVREEVQRHRQRLGVAQAELETTLGKSFRPQTLKRFVKKRGCV